MTSDVCREPAEEIERRLRLKTFPLAVKMLEKEQDIPEGAVRPKRDLGYHLATCQGFAMSRREGTLLAMLKEDMWCSESVIGLGLAEPPAVLSRWIYRAGRRTATVRRTDNGCNRDVCQEYSRNQLRYFTV